MEHRIFDWLTVAILIGISLSIVATITDYAVTRVIQAWRHIKLVLNNQGTEEE